MDNALGAERYYFGYTSEATTPIALPVGSRNLVQNVAPASTPLVPSVFAPGRVSPAFWVYREPGAEPPSWTLDGPDRIVRSATPAAEPVVCTAELLRPTGSDSRTPDLTLAATTSGDGSRVELIGTVTGVPTASVCPAGTTAEPVTIATDDSFDGTSTPGGERNESLEVFTTTDPATGSSRSFTRTSISVVVIDRCSFEGETSSSWPMAQAFERLRLGILVCITVEAGKVTILPLDQPANCPGGLPATGGIRTR